MLAPPTPAPRTPGAVLAVPVGHRGASCALAPALPLLGTRLAAGEGLELPSASAGWAFRDWGATLKCSGLSMSGQVGK